MSDHTPIFENGVDVADPDIIREDDVRDLDIRTSSGATLDTARLLAKIYPDAYGLSGVLPWRQTWKSPSLWPPCPTNRCTRGRLFEFATRILNDKCRKCLEADELEKKAEDRIKELTQARTDAKI